MLQLEALTFVRSRQVTLDANAIPHRSKVAVGIHHHEIAPPFENYLDVHGS